MRSCFHQLSIQHLTALISALRSHRLVLPFSRIAVQQEVPHNLGDILTQELQQLADTGMTPHHIAQGLEWLREEKSIHQQHDDRINLVWTGPETPGASLRDTFVVVREMFESAITSVLIASYSLDQPEHTHDLFAPLARKMQQNPDLQVRLFVNIGRKYQDDTPESVLLREFSEQFRQKLWPGSLLPEVFYDPRALELNTEQRACFHAKCIIIDNQRFLITSANLSEAAQLRNIETGILIHDARRAVILRQQFDTLVEYGMLRKVNLR